MAFLKRKPELDQGGFVLAHAYAKLSTARQNGMGLGAIPINVIWDWQDRSGIRDPRVRAHVDAVLLAVDAITLRRASKTPSSSTREPVEAAKSPVRRRRRQ